MSRNVSGPMSLIRLKRKSLRHKDKKTKKKKRERIIICIPPVCDWQSVYICVCVQHPIESLSFILLQLCRHSVVYSESRDRRDRPWLFGTKHHHALARWRSRSNPPPSTIQYWMKVDWAHTHTHTHTQTSSPLHTETRCATFMTRENTRTWGKRFLFFSSPPLADRPKRGGGNRQIVGREKKKKKKFH